MKAKVGVYEAISEEGCRWSLTRERTGREYPGVWPPLAVDAHTVDAAVVDGTSELDDGWVVPTHAVSWSLDAAASAFFEGKGDS
jgi:hypothetical protein